MLKTKISNLQRSRSMLDQAWLLLLHIFLGIHHVLAYLFLPSARSFQQMHDLTDDGYQVSYLKHCRTQHNVRFGTLAYSLVLACGIAFVTAAVEIINPQKFGQPVYAASLIVNSAADDDDGLCTAAPGDCTLREAVNVAVNGDVINFTGPFNITLLSNLAVDTSITISAVGVGGSGVVISCNNNPAITVGLPIVASNITLDTLTIKQCARGVQSGAGVNNLKVQNSTFKDNTTIGLQALNNNGVQSLTNTFTGNATALDYNTTTGGKASNNTFISNTVGINIANSSPIAVQGSSFTSCATVCIGATNSIVAVGVDGAGLGTGNTFTDTDGTSINLVSSETSSIKDNTFDNAGAEMILLDSSEAVLIESNTFQNATTADKAIRALLSPGLTIQLNTFSDFSSSESFGIYYEDSTVSPASTAIVSNTFTNMAGKSINILTGDVVSIHSNTFTSGGTGVVIDGGDNNAIYNNTFTTLTGVGVQLLNTTVGTVVGRGVVGNFDGNTFTDMPTATAVVGTGHSDYNIRLNNYTGVDSLILLSEGATTEYADPAIDTHNVDTITGTNGVLPDPEFIDVYGSVTATDAVTYLGTATVTDSAWSYTDAALVNYDAIILLAVGSGGISGLVNSVQPSASTEISNVVAASITTAAATISWDTNISTDGSVSYSTNADLSSATTVLDNTTAVSHSVTLTGLAANTTYYYTVTSADATQSKNTDTSDIKSFTTAAEENGNDDGLTLSEYATRVAQRVTVTHRGGTTEIDADTVTSSQFPYGNLTFTFTDNQERLAGNSLRFVLREPATNTRVQSNTKAFNAQHKASFLVKKARLSLEKTYAVLTAVVDSGNNFVNDDGLKRRFTFTLLDAPELLYPSTTVYNGMPEQFVVSSKAPSVTVFLDDMNGNEQLHCVATMTENIGACTPPFSLPIGLYNVRLVDARGGTISRSLMVSALASNNTVNTDARSADYFKRIITSGKPNFVGVVATGHTVELNIPQIGGPMLANVLPSSGPVTNWTFTLNLTTLPFGETTFRIVDRNPNGSIANEDNVMVYRAHGAVMPAIVGTDSGQSFTSAPTVQVVGPNDHELEILNSSGTRLDRVGYVNGGYALDLSQWFTDYGTYTVTLRNRNAVNIASRTLDFTFSIVPPVTVTTTTTTETDTNTNTSTDTGTETSTNTNTETNTNTDTTTSNDNTNAVNGNVNDNTNGSVGNDNINETNGNVDNTNGGTNTNTTTLENDPDQDGLTTTEEETTYETDPFDADSDDDGMTDLDEVEFTSNPLDPDTDDDGLTDPQEYTLRTDPNDVDTDDDNVQDAAEVVTTTSPTDADTDDDALLDDETSSYGTNPVDADSDNDRLLDGEEIDRSCDPLNMDTDGDEIDDMTEALAGTNCASADNVWSNLEGLEDYLQDKANTQYSATGTELITYPTLTSRLVESDAQLGSQLKSSIQTSTVVNVLPGVNTVVSDGEVKVITHTTTVSLLDWITNNDPDTYDATSLVISGSVDLPANVEEQPAYVLVTFFSTPVVKIARVGDNGQWTMTVPAELLTTGEHTALAALDVNGTQSDQVQVAKFVIKQERKLSNTAWLVIINVVVAIIALLTAWYIHIRRQRADQKAAV